MVAQDKHLFSKMKLDEVRMNSSLYTDGLFSHVDLGFRLAPKQRFSIGGGGSIYRGQNRLIHDEENGYAFFLTASVEHYWTSTEEFKGLYTGLGTGFWDLSITWEEGDRKGTTDIQTFQPSIYMGYRFPLSEKWISGVQAGYSHLIELREVGQNINLNGGLLVGLTLARKL